jgi:hypothetical protein
MNGAAWTRTWNHGRKAAEVPRNLSAFSGVGFDETLVNRLAIPVALAGALLGTSAASAKEPPQTTVCGRSLSMPTERACLHLNDLNDRDEIRYQLADSGEPFELRSRPRPAPFYTVTFRYREDRRWNWWFLYVPSRGLIRQTTSVGMVTPGSRDTYWRTAPTNVTRAFETLSKRFRPFPAPRRWR